MDKYQQVVNLWQSYTINNENDLDKYLDNFKILFAYHSNKIENNEINYYDTRELFVKGQVVNYNGNPKTLFEQQNQKLVYLFLKSKIVNKIPITIDLIKSVHLMLTSGTYDEKSYLINNERPGSFKRHDYIVGINEVGSSVEAVEDDINELIAEINHPFSASDLLVVAAYFHARFEHIHPFADGNATLRHQLNMA